MLKIVDIHTYYGYSYVLQGISLEVARGTVVALLGRNGVGKTTLIRSIVGFTPARRGQILFNDRNITHMPSYKIVRLQIGLVPQGRRIFPSLTVRENLAVAARDSGVQGWDFESIYALFSRLRDRRNQRANTLSGGEQQMLAIARVMVTKPKLVLMDEPSEGLMPVLVAEIRRVIKQMRDEGFTILLIDQDFKMCLEISDRAYIMEKGIIRYQGETKELMENKEILFNYLGVS